MRSVHVLIILLHIGLKRLIQSTSLNNIVSVFIPYLDVIGLYSKNLILRIIVRCSLYKVLPDCLNCFNKTIYNGFAFYD